MSRSVRTEVSAPGKLYLFGEYAVLAGSWSVVAAVDRRVRAERFDEVGSYTARGLEGDDGRLVRAVLEAVEGETGESFDAGHFATDVRAMYENGVKLGLGSSAASSVALTAAALADGEKVDGRSFRRTVLEVAERAHASFQGGLGSGGGIVSATMGGISACRRREPTSGFLELSRHLELEDVGGTEAFVYSDVSLPDELETRAIWLGEPASTTDFVAKVVDRLRLDPDGVYRRLRKLGRLAEKAIEAARRSDATGFCDCVREADSAMERLGEACEIPIVVDRHRRLREVAEPFDVAVKPSGAGGGDFSLVVGREEADWSSLEARLPDDLRSVALDFGAEGVRAEA